MSTPIRGRSLARQRERAFRTRGAHACVARFSINADLDTRYVLVPLDVAQELLDRKGSVSRFELKGARGWSQDRLAQSVKDNLAAQLGEDVSLRTLTRNEKHKFITQTNRVEKWATFAILSFILVVAVHSTSWLR